MHDKEIQIFTDALKLARDEFYIDSLIEFRCLIDQFPESELVDDSYFNMGLCFFNMNQFDKAKESFEFVISNYPDSTISILDGGNEFGRTAAKCYLGIINCFLGMDDLNSATAILEHLAEYTDSFMQHSNGEKELFHSIGEKAIEIYISLNQSKNSNN